MADTFSDLPDALVRDLLSKAVPIGDAVRRWMEGLRLARDHVRETAKKQKMICQKADLDVTREPSVAGVDGSYQIHRLTALDLCAAAAVAVEGTAKEDRRHWQEPYHRIWVDGLPHDVDSVGPLRGLMVSMEIELASEAPHDLVLLDGSFSSLVIYLNQGLSKLSGDKSLSTSPLSAELSRQWYERTLFQRLLALLQSDRTVAIPKYTSKNELTKKLGIELPEQTDGKTLGTLILEAGEYTSPIPIEHQEEPYHLPKADNEALNRVLHDIHVVYYRPFHWLPALRLEMPGPAARNSQKLSMVLEGIMRQLFSPAVYEPYPLFLADRMVKSLGAGVAVIEQSVSQHVVGSSADVETALLYLQNYRTEGGRGGV
jgi:hypothetical protein